MKEIRVESLKEFFQLVDARIHENREENLKQTGAVSPLRFRGQARSIWPLASTLDRSFSPETSFNSYHGMMMRAASSASSALGTEHVVSSSPPRPNDDMPPTTSDFKDLPFMVYARHHGFPSPLLDWTASPYVALYFALGDKAIADHDETDAAVFIYCESDSGFKGGWIGDPLIIATGPYIRSHPRHFQQQASYTLCVKEVRDSWHYVRHEEVFNKRVDGQDMLEKIVLPGGLREEALERLERFNINAFTLFGGEDALMHTLAQREIAEYREMLRKRRPRESEAGLNNPQPESITG